MKRDFSGKQWHTNPHVFKQQCTFDKAIMGPGGLNTSPIWADAPQFGLCDPDYAHFFFDDFHEFVTGDVWTGAETNSGTLGIYDAKGGVIQLLCDGADNDSAYITTTSEMWAIDSTDKIYFEAKVKLTEANTDDANVFVGLTADTAATAVPMQAAGGGPTAVDHIGLWKVDGGTVWQYGTSDGSTQDTGSTGITRSSGTWTRLGFIADVNRVDFYIDSVKVASVVDAADIPDQEMHIVIHLKNGGGNAESLLVDWVKCVAIR
jgi:hypothetical protein